MRCGWPSSTLASDRPKRGVEGVVLTGGLKSTGNVSKKCQSGALSLCCAEVKHPLGLSHIKSAASQCALLAVVHALTAQIAEYTGSHRPSVPTSYCHTNPEQGTQQWAAGHNRMHRMRVPSIMQLPARMGVLVAIAVCVLGGGAMPADASMVTEVLSAEGHAPDFTQPLAVVTLIVGVLFLPLYSWGLLGVIKHRKHYPIAGRGSTYLICHAVAFLFGHIAVCLIQMTHPYGVPCGMQFVLTFFITLPHSYCYMLRAFILIFRLEIQNFLQETHWREEQLEARVAKEQDVADVAEAEKMIAATTTAAGEKQISTITASTTMSSNDRPVSVRPVLVVAGTELELSVKALPSPSSLGGIPSPVAVPSPNSATGKQTSNNKTIAPQNAQRIPFHGVLPLPYGDSAVHGSLMLHRDQQERIESREGYWFIISRRYIEPMWLAVYVTVLTCLVLVAMLIISILDPDTELTNDFYHSSGALPAEVSYTGSQLSPSNFLISPPCLLYSTKEFVFRGVSLLLFAPVVLTLWWKVRGNKRRMRLREEVMKREREKQEREVKELEGRVRELQGKIAAQQQQNGDPPPATLGWPTTAQLTTPKRGSTLSYLTPTPKPTAAERCLSPVSRSRHHRDSLVPDGTNGLVTTRGSVLLSRRVARGAEGEHGSIVVSKQAVRGGQIADSDLVQRELLLVIVVGAVGTVFYSLLEWLANAWLNSISLLLSIVIWSLTVAQPLWISRQMSKRHRQFLHANRESVLLAKGGLFTPSSGGGTGGTRSTRDLGLNTAHRASLAAPLKLQHHLPYFQMSFILGSRQCFPVFLRFLQKEYSSENALFYKECTAFHTRVAELEKQITTWPSSTSSSARAAREGREEGGVETSLSAQEVEGGTAVTGGGGSRNSVRPSHEPSLPKPSTPTRPPSVVRMPSILKATSIGGGVRPSNRRHGKVASVSIDITEHAMAFVSPSPEPEMQEEVRGVESPLEPQQHEVAIVTNSPVTVEATTASVYQNAKLSLLLNEEMVASEVPMTMQNPSPTPEQLHLQHSTSRERQPSPGVAPSSLLPRLTPSEFSHLHEEAARMKFWCLQLWETYLRKNSIYEVNIPAAESTLIQESIRKIEEYEPTPRDDDGQVREDLKSSTFPVPPPLPFSSVYARVCGTVFDLLQRDSFRRFVDTPEFQQLLRKADDEQLEKAEQQPDLAEETKEVIDAAVKEIEIKKQQGIQRTLTGHALGAGLTVAPFRARTPSRNGGTVAGSLTPGPLTRDLSTRLAVDGRSTPVSKTKDDNLFSTVSQPRRSLNQSEATKPIVTRTGSDGVVISEASQSEAR